MTSKVHVLSESRPGRLICGRQKPAIVRLVASEKAMGNPELCEKCRRQVAWEIRRAEIRRAPKPGLQHVFDSVKEWT